MLATFRLRIASHNPTSMTPRRSRKPTFCQHLMSVARIQCRAFRADKLDAIVERRPPVSLRDQGQMLDKLEFLLLLARERHFGRAAEAAEWMRVERQHDPQRAGDRALFRRSADQQAWLKSSGRARAACGRASVGNRAGKGFGVERGLWDEAGLIARGWLAMGGLAGFPRFGAID